MHLSRLILAALTFAALPACVSQSQKMAQKPRPAAAAALPDSPFTRAIAADGASGGARSVTPGGATGLTYVPTGPVIDLAEPPEPVILNRRTYIFVSAPAGPACCRPPR